MELPSRRQVFRPPAHQVEEAARRLDYQPFIISDDIQTGAAYSCLKGDRTDSMLVFRRNERTPANGRIRLLLGKAAGNVRRFSCRDCPTSAGETFLDVACNNGYFPVKARLLGMQH